GRACRCRPGSDRAAGSERHRSSLSLREHLGKARAPFARQLRRQRDRLVAHRVQEGERAGVAGDGGAEGAYGAVARIAVDGMAVMGELNAELMRASRLRPNFEPGQVAMGAAALKVQQRLASPGRMWLQDVHAVRIRIFS